MKELLELAYNDGYARSWDENQVSFEQWYEQNQSKIDDAIEQHIKDNYPTLHSAFVIAKLAKQYAIEVVPKSEGNEQDITLATFGLDNNEHDFDYDTTH